MAKLKPVLDTLEGVPPALADIYAKGTDGKFRPQIDGDGWSIGKDGPIKEALQQERSKVAALQKELRPYGRVLHDDGTIHDAPEGRLDPKMARDLLSKFPDGKVDTPQDVKALERQYEEKHARYKDEVQQERSQDLNDFREVLITGDAERTIKALGGKDHTVKLLMPTIKERTKMERVNGRMRAVAMDEHGRTLLSREPGSTDPMGVAEFVKVLRADDQFSAVWPGKAAGGSGSDLVGGGSANGATKNVEPGSATALQLLQQAHGAE